MRYDEQTALIVVDMQNDFADPAGSLFVPGGDALLAAVNREIEAAVAAGAVVFYTQDWHPPQTPHFVTDGGMWPVHCVRDTWGAQLVDGLVVAGPAVRKGVGGEDGYSGFTTRDPQTGVANPTALGGLVDESGRRAVVVVGLAADYCVKHTALDAVRLGYETTVVTDAVRAVDREPGDGVQALADLSAAGVLLHHARG